jgi:ADP-ribose pyrophosphatase YjhB (NUDIX family)
MDSTVRAAPQQHQEAAMTTDVTDTRPGWLAPDSLEAARGQVPIVYVEAVPVRVDHLGRIERIGLLLGAQPDGTFARAIVSGRVLHNETVREALWRHLTKDLGPDADPQLPTGNAPFTVVEYFPDPERSGFHDPRQHAVALCFIVPVDGECAPSQHALEFSWLTPEEAVGGGVASELSDGHERLVRRALAHCGTTLA